VFPLTQPTLNFIPDPRNFIDPLKKKYFVPKIYNTSMYLQPVQIYGQFCMCTEALWIQEIKPLFNSKKILIIVLEFGMYSLELETIFKKNNNNIYLQPTYTIFFTTLAETQHFCVWPKHY
jgi:hypothetical protein